jgi:hypothetical protein
VLANIAHAVCQCLKNTTEMYFLLSFLETPLRKINILPVLKGFPISVLQINAVY